MINKAMLMSAGLGTRLRPFTEVTTKALIPVMGVPSALYAIDSLSNSGVSRIVANAHHNFNQTRDGLLSFQSPDLKIEISDESQELLGSSGGIRNALPLLGEGAFFLANADVICDVNWRALESCHQRLRSKWGVEITLAIFPVGPSGGSYREILFDTNTGLISGLGELSTQKPFYVGAAVLETDALKNVPQGSPSEFIPKILEPAIRERKAGVFLSAGTWFDIGSPSLWLKTHLSLISRLETGLFPSPVSKIWRKRLEEVNYRLSENVWASKSNSAFARNCQWLGPCYWGNEENGTFTSTSKIKPSGSNFPSSFGPNAVLYGNSIERMQGHTGIGYGGNWVSVPEIEIGSI